MSRNKPLPIFVNGNFGFAKIVKKCHGYDGISVMIEVPFHLEGNAKAFLDKLFQENLNRRNLE